MKKILCFFGFHEWTCSIQDYIDEFGFVPFTDVISSKAKCSRCGEPYKKWVRYDK